MIGMPKPEIVAGWTPGAYGIWVIVATIAGYIVRQYVPWFKANTEREAGVTGALQTLVDKLQKRIDDLEDALREERKRCDEETRSLHGKIEALQKLIIQWQVSTGHVIEIGQHAPKATEAMHRMAAKMGDQE